MLKRVMFEELSRIEWGGSDKDLIWKSPIRNFSSGSSVIVHESQGAVFYVNGQCSEVFDADLHIVETSNVPFVKKIIEHITHNKTPFTAELYYFSKRELPQIKWGVPSIMYSEKNCSFPIKANGSYRVRVADGRKLIAKIAGQNASYDIESLQERFCDDIRVIVKDKIVHVLNDNNISIIHSSGKLLDIANIIEPFIAETFAEYGIELTKFFLNEIIFDDNDSSFLRLKSLLENQGMQQEEILLEQAFKIQHANIDAEAEQIAKMREIDTEVYRQRQLAMAQGFGRQVQGYTYQDERRFDVLQDSANNTGNSSGIANSIMNVGMGISAASAMTGMMRDTMSSMGADTASMQHNVSPALASGIKVCTNCGQTILQGSRFCNTCGTPVAISNTIVCPNCGHELAQDAKFCNMCGTPVEQSNKKVCANCGHDLEESSMFCMICGTPVNKEPANKVCPNCNTEFPPESMFCDKCGTKL